VNRAFILLLPIFAGTAAAQSSDISAARSRDIWVNAGWTAISSGYIGTDQLTGGGAHDLQVNGGVRFAVRFDLSQGEHIGHEFQYVNSRMPVQYNYAPGAPQLGAAINEGGYNFIGYINGRESRARFFGTVGAQLTDFVRPSDSAIGCESANCTVASQPPTTAGNFKMGFNYGAGAKIKLKSRYGVRFDVRQYVSGKPFNLPLASGLLRQTEISAGFGVSF
jgi:Outer membrane protein beta-barrel domain